MLKFEKPLLLVVGSGLKYKTTKRMTQTGKTPNDRIENAENSLIGRWFSETIGIFFNGTDGLGDIGILFLGNPELSIFGEGRYQVFINNDSELYLILILNGDTANFKTREYKIRIIDYDKKELLLESSEGALISLTK